MTPQALQRKVKQYLVAVGIEPDMMDSYGSLMIFRKRIDQEAEPNAKKESAKWYAWRISDRLRGCEIYDYFEAWFEGSEYYVVRFEVPDQLPTPPIVAREEVRVEPKAKATPAKAKPAVVVEAQPVVIEKQPEPAKVENPAPVMIVKREIEGLGSLGEKGVEAAVGQIVWTIVSKKGGKELKQARGEIVAVYPGLALGDGGSLAEVRLTKTGTVMRVGLDKLFDHVPHPKAGGVWK